MVAPLETGPAPLEGEPVTLVSSVEAAGDEVTAPVPVPVVAPLAAESVGAGTVPVAEGVPLYPRIVVVPTTVLAAEPLPTTEVKVEVATGVWVGTPPGPPAPAPTMLQTVDREVDEMVLPSVVTTMTEVAVLTAVLLLPYCIVSFRLFNGSNPPVGVDSHHRLFHRYQQWQPGY